MVQLRRSGVGPEALVAELSTFPSILGRSSQCHVRLKGNGVWEEHARLDWDQETHRIKFQTVGAALAQINGVPTEEALLKPGDVIALGVERLQFFLTPPRPRPLKGREIVTWMLLASVGLVEVGVVYWALGVAS